MASALLDESDIRAVVIAGREAAPGLQQPDVVDTATYRTIATALLGQQRESALDALAVSPAGASRFQAMATKARQVTESSAMQLDARQVLLLHTAVDMAFVRALTRRREQLDATYECFAGSVGRIVSAESYEAVCAAAAAAVRELSGMQAAALYVPSDERARFVAAARDESHDATAPLYLRIDRGLFADVIASERVVVVSGHESVEALSSADMPVRTLVAVPLRDTLNRPIGLALAMASEQERPGLATVETLRRFGIVVAGVLETRQAARRQYAALATLPRLAGVASQLDLPVTDQLERLAEIGVLATDSDSAIVRVCDAAGSYIETRAVYSRRGDAVSDLVGSRAALQPPLDSSEFGETEHEIVDPAPDLPWSDAGLRILGTLGARTVETFPIPSLYARPGVLYVVRKTARPFDDVDRACARILVANVQNAIDRHISDVQTARSITAARSAIHLLGEGLVAGVQVERTLRFVPRLYHEMFDCSGCRVWRYSHREGRALISGSGMVEADHGQAVVQQALETPLELFLATEQRPHTAAVGIAEYHGTNIAVEFELQHDRTLGAEEQRLAVEVAARISEALYSAEQAVVHQQQLELVRSLQNIVARAHEQLAETHVVSTIIDEVPALLGSDAAAVFVIDDHGSLETRTVRDVPTRLTHAIEEARHWVPDAVGDERTSTLAIERLGADERVASLNAEIVRAGFGDHAALMLPLTGRDRIVGCLMLLFAGTLPRGFETERNLPSFGHHLGAALLNAREHERERAGRVRTQRVLDHERDASRQVRALYDISRTFATSLSRDETMQAAVEAVADRLDVDAVWLRTPNERGDSFDLRAFHSPHAQLATALERMIGVPIPRSDRLTRHVMESNAPVLITPDDLAESEFSDTPTLRRLLPFLQRGSTVAVLPVATANEVLGTVTMLSLSHDQQLTYEKTDIAAGVAAQAALAIDHARLYEQQKRFAQVIHDSLLPRKLPRLPGVELGVLYRSATKGGEYVGGDFYDFLELENGRLAMVLGDVCGKGIAAAADTAMTKYIFRALARENPAPAEFLSRANEVVCEEITPGKFVTLFYAVIDPANNIVSCGKAGHPEPKIMYRGEGGKTRIESVAVEGLALGILNDQDYEQRDYHFPEGAAIAVYTDGVVEARRGGKLYGQYRLEQRLQREGDRYLDRPGGSRFVAYGVFEDCSQYSEEGLNDDVAIVVAQHVAPATQSDDEDVSTVQFAEDAATLSEGGQ